MLAGNTPQHFVARDCVLAQVEIEIKTLFEPAQNLGWKLARNENFMNQTLGTLGTFGTLGTLFSVPVAFAEAAVVTVHGRLDHTHRIVRRTLESILTKADRDPGLRAAAEGGVAP
ncbi:MAG TPA: hypothetical protein VNT81_11060 [Vicinamibacterales bacterium]|nr:hypothetical protein [Vicinamibacterales bacterium]